MNVCRRDGRIIIANDIGTELFDLSVEEALIAVTDIADATAMARLETPGKTYDHEASPDDLPEDGERCKTCGEDITWVGPSQYDYLHVDDKENR